MPDMNGLELLRHIKQVASQMKMGIITALFLIGGCLSGMSAGPDEVNRTAQMNQTNASLLELVHREASNDVIARTFYEAEESRLFLTEIGVAIASGWNPSSQD